jgi:hypothetical protein
MPIVVTARNACADPGAFHYQRHRPEKTLLYQLVSKHYPVFRRKLAEEGRALPDNVQREFEDYLKCGRLEHGFLRVHCETCHEERVAARADERKKLERLCRYIALHGCRVLRRLGTTATASRSGKALIVDTRWQCSLPVEDTVPRKLAP